MRLKDGELVGLRARLAVWERDWRGLELGQADAHGPAEGGSLALLDGALAGETGAAETGAGSSISRPRTCAASMASWRRSAQGAYRIRTRAWRTRCRTGVPPASAALPAAGARAAGDERITAARSGGSTTWIATAWRSVSSSVTSPSTRAGELAILSSIRAEAWDALDLRFPLPLKRTFSQMAQERTTMNTSLLYAISPESALYPLAQSPVGARGLMQLMPATARDGLGKLGSPIATSSSCSAGHEHSPRRRLHLKRLLDVYDGNRILAAAACSAGPGRVKRWREQSENKPMDVWVESFPIGRRATMSQNVLSFDLIYQHKLQQPTFHVGCELNHAY